jgi:hypothetical protein
MSTCASVATRVNAAGLIETIPVDTVRLDHDPVTLDQKGLLVKEARTILLPNFNKVRWLGSNKDISRN